jgi:hypothetical protein
MHFVAGVSGELQEVSVRIHSQSMNKKIIYVINSDYSGYLYIIFPTAVFA